MTRIPRVGATTPLAKDWHRPACFLPMLALILALSPDARQAAAQPSPDPPPQGAALDKSAFVSLKLEIQQPCYTLSLQNLSISIAAGPIDAEARHLMDSPATDAEREADRAAQIALAFKSTFPHRLDKFGCRSATEDELGDAHAGRFFDRLSEGNAVLVKANGGPPLARVHLRHFGDPHQGSTFFYVPDESAWFHVSLGYIR